MFAIKFVLAACLVVASARHLPWDDQWNGEGHLGYNEDHQFDDIYPTFQDVPQPEDFYHPAHLARSRRQAQGSVSLNSDGGIGLGAKIPLAGNDKNQLSALGSVDLNNRMQAASKGLGLQLDNVNGHSLTVMKQNVPGFGDRLTGAAKLNVFHNDNHNVDVRGSLTRNMPTIPNVPNFNTVGGGVDYMYKNKVGASLGMASTPFLDRKDYSAMGNLNLFRSPATSVDFNAGFSRFDTPIRSSGWQPNFGLMFSRSF